MRSRLIALLIWITALPIGADLIHYRADLDGLQIIPSASDLGETASLATGTMELTLDTMTETFTIDVQMNDLQGNYLPCFLPQGICSGAHLHLGQVGEATSTHIYNTRENRWENAAGNQNPAPGDWSYAAVSQVFINRTFSEAINELDTGKVYFNVHSDFMTTGEIRGQVYLIPEPASASLMLWGALACRLLLRRRLECA